MNFGGNTSQSIIPLDPSLGPEVPRWSSFSIYFQSLLRLVLHLMARTLHCTWWGEIAKICLLHLLENRSLFLAFLL